MSAAEQLQQPATRRRAPRWRGPEDLPPGLLEALESKVEYRTVAERFNVSTYRLVRWRQKLLPEQERKRGMKKGTRLVRAPSLAPRKDAARQPTTSKLKDREGLTPRQREVASRPITPTLLAELIRERPGGAADICVVCWRNTKGSKLSAVLACSYTLPGITTQPCQVLVSRCKEAAERAQERAKASLFEEGQP